MEGPVHPSKESCVKLDTQVTEKRFTIGFSLLLSMYMVCPGHVGVVQAGSSNVTALDSQCGTECSWPEELTLEGEQDLSRHIWSTPEPF